MCRLVCFGDMRQNCRKFHQEINAINSQIYSISTCQNIALFHPQTCCCFCCCCWALTVMQQQQVQNRLTDRLTDSCISHKCCMQNSWWMANTRSRWKTDWVSSREWNLKCCLLCEDTYLSWTQFKDHSYCIYFTFGPENIFITSFKTCILMICLDSLLFSV